MLRRLLFLPLFVLTLSAAPFYNITRISLPAGAYLPAPVAINDAGEIAGNYSVNPAGGGLFNTRAFVIQSGAFQDLNGSAFSSNAQAMSESGRVAGYQFDNMAIRPAVSSPGAPLAGLAKAPSDLYGYAQAISPDGSLVLIGDTAGKDIVVSGEHYGDFSTFPGVGFSGSGINDQGDIAGSWTGACCDYFAAYQPQGGTAKTITNAPSRATDITNSGLVGGYFADTNQIFVYRTQTEELEVFDGLAGAHRTFVAGMNDAGTLVGTDLDGRAFLHQAGVTYNLLSLVRNSAGWSKLSFAVDINNHGQILGRGTYNGEEVMFRLDPVAVPVRIGPKLACWFS